MFWNKTLPRLCQVFCYQRGFTKLPVRRKFKSTWNPHFCSFFKPAQGAPRDRNIPNWYSNVLYFLALYFWNKFILKGQKPQSQDKGIFDIYQQKKLSTIITILSMFKECLPQILHFCYSISSPFFNTQPNG